MVLYQTIKTLSDFDSGWVVFVARTSFSTSVCLFPNLNGKTEQCEAASDEMMEFQTALGNGGPMVAETSKCCLSATNTSLQQLDG